MTSRPAALGYNSWHHMISRCYNKRNPKYPIYGGRGITVCEEWRASYDTFLSDMGPKPKGASTSRNILIEFKGVTKPLCTWADEIGMNQCTLWSRIRQLGWSVERALTEKTREW